MGATSPNKSSGEPPWLHVRREPFDFGLLPLLSLAHKIADGVPSLLSIKQRLLTAASKSPASSSGSQAPRVGKAAIAECLGLSDAHAHLVLDTLASILPEGGGGVAVADPLATAPAVHVEKVGADVDALVLFLILQLYKRLPHRSHRDASAVADVWPQPNPFDGFLPSPNSVQKSPNSRHGRTGWSFAEEEQHQMQFILKHLPHVLAAIGEDGEEGQVIGQAHFDRLSLIFWVAVGEGMPLSQATPFFANSDPAMPAVPVPAAKVQEWLSQHICTASAHSNREESVGGSSTSGATESGSTDVGMADVSHAAGGGSGSSLLGGSSSGGMPLANGTVSPWGGGKDWTPEGVTCVDGVTKMSVLKGENNIENGCIRVSHCHDAVVYVLGPLRYASVFGCTDCIVVLGATGRAVKVEHCERLQLIAPCARIRIANCRECVFYLGTNQHPLVLGDNHKIQVAPYNTFYPRLDAHLAAVGVDPGVNLWGQPIVLGKADPHDGITPSAGLADQESEPATLLPPERFVPFVVPFRAPPAPGADPSQPPPQATRANPFVLPKAYLQALQQKTKTVETLRQTLKSAVLEENKKKELTNVIQAHFKEWLISSGNIRQVYDLARLDRE